MSGRRLLACGWQMCATAPQACAQPGDWPADLHWVDAPKLGPVADVLRQTGAWSLDDSSGRRFDGQDWWFRLHFEHDATVSGAPAAGFASLGLDGLATVAEVWLNGVPVLSCTNMFMAYQLDVADQLKPGVNELVLVFRSLDHDLTQRRPRPRWRSPMIENQQLRWRRTTVLGRTPGWSPPCQVVGPWGDIWLETGALAKLGRVHLRPSLVGDGGRVDFAAQLALAPSTPLIDAHLVLSWGDQRHMATAGCDDTGHVSATLSLDQVHKWWPHTHGHPNLYRAELSVSLQGAEEPVVFDLGPVGFRTIDVQRQDGDFAVQVNGVPVFCRGACWTPLDPVTLRADAASYHQSVTQVVEAGMNMVRVGGTMVYEADAFYDACDELGVLVWQEFMFANMDYPQDEAFVGEVRVEAEQQLRRWQARPCLAVLCGNSEVEQQAAMWGATRDKWAPALFHETLADMAKQWRPDVVYWPSSAHGGAFPHQGDAGTTSYYGVGAYQRPLEDARRANLRFATEALAFSNVPEMPALVAMPGGLGLRMHHPNWRARAPRDLGAGWDFEDVRDHYLQRCFDVDPMRLRYADHDRYLLLSRITTGEVMSAVFQEWRRPDSPCRGALIWFLRDLWPGAGWGVIDSLGHPKSAYYALKRTLQPIALGLTDEGGNGLYAHLTNESPRPIAATLQVSAYRSGGVSAGQGAIPLALGAHDGRTVPLAACFDWFTDLNWAYRFGPAVAQVVVASWVAEDGALLAQACHFPQGLNLPREADVGLVAQACCGAQGQWSLTVSARSFAQSVQLELNGYVPDDAYFHLAPGQSRQVGLKALPGFTGPVSGTVKALNSEASALIQICTSQETTA